MDESVSCGKPNLAPGSGLANIGFMEDHPDQHSDPAPSCVSLQSMEDPISFQKQPFAVSHECKEVLLDQNSENERVQQRALSSEQSCVSLKSDSSMEHPISFKANIQSYESRSFTDKHKTKLCLVDILQLSLSNEMLSHNRAVQCSFSDDGSELHKVKPHVNHSPLMTELRARIEQFMESELEYLDRILCEEHEGGSEMDRAEVDDEDIRRSRDAVLHLCVHFLRDMKREQLAESLLSQTKIAKGVSILKSSLKKRFQHVFEGLTKLGHQKDLNEIYTDVWITEGYTGGVNFEHEIHQIETASYKHHGRSVRCQDIFDILLHGGQSERTLLTEGVAGIGKTLCVQKVLLDWAEHKAHHNIRFMLPFNFRELNVLRGKSFSLVSLVQHFFLELKEAGICSFDNVSVLLIFDGLDESRFTLDFHNCPSLRESTESVPLDVLLVNLIRGNLLPSARLWITTRPAAAKQIPAEYISIVTEVRGFTNSQKEQYFKKRFEDELHATTVISHMKKHRSLHFMCYIPIFCWILSTVLLHMLDSGTIGQLPQTLTQMYIHFLVVQMKVKNLKYDGCSELDSPWIPETRKMVESLGKLAFEQLQKGNLIFYESDLRECGLDPEAASVCSGVFTQIFKEESGLYQDKVYCFIHLTVQEFLAALHVHLTFFNSGVNLLSEAPSSIPRMKPVNDREAEKSFYLIAVNKALQSSNGNLDLFLRFLLGLSLESNHNLLQGLMKHIQLSSHASREAAAHVKDKIMEDLDSDKAINLFHCLNELGDRSLLEEVQKFLSSQHLPADKLSSVQWSAVVFLLRIDPCDVFELRRFYCSEKVFFRLLPVIKVSKEANLSGCNLSLPCWEKLATVLKSESCQINKLDLRYTDLQDSGLSALTYGLCSLLKKLQHLRLRGCGLTESSCRTLCDLLSSPLSALTQLDVSDNNLQDAGFTLLSEGLRSSHCAITSLRLDGCNLTSKSCKELSEVLQSPTSVLSDLNLSNNPLQDSGVEILCSGLKDPHCSLETLRLSGCLLTEKGFRILTDALTSCQLKELDLRYNHLGDQNLSLEQKLSSCSLTTLRTAHCGEHRLQPGLQKYACEVTMDLKTAHDCLVWFENNSFTEDDTEVTQNQNGSDKFEFWHQVVSNESLTGRCYWEVKWKGLVSIAMTYKGIERRGSSCHSMFGGNSQSWALDCSSEYYVALHNNIAVKRIARQAWEDYCGDAESRVGVFLDWDEGVLSFFSVRPDGQRLIHTFHSSFSETLLPGFRLRSEFTLDSCNFVSVRPLHV